MRPIRLLQTSGQGFLLTDAAAVFSGTQLDERMVVDHTDTVLDPKVCANGAWIDLPVPCKDWAGREIRQVWYPAFDNQRQGRIVTLCRMAIAGNRLLRIIQGFNEGLIPQEFLERGLMTYQMAAIQQLGGKNGVVGANIIAGRVRHSGRGVLVVNATHSPEWISIPLEMMTRMGLDSGDLAILGREPTVWGGSIEVVKVRHSRSNAVEVHPLLFKQLGADCDGDTVYVYAVPKDADCQAEAAKQLLGFAKGFAKWPSYMRLGNPSEEVDWENVQNDSKGRSVITGFSVSPDEIVAQGERLKHLCATTGKDVAAECLTVASGIQTERYKDYVEDQNDALVTMKLGMGPIGAAANKLRLLAGVDRRLLTSASYLSERLQQILLDTKHTIGVRDTYSIQDILAMLNRREPYSRMHLEDVLDELAKVGIERERVWPIMAYFWIIWPLTRAVRSLYPTMTSGRAQRIEGYIAEFEFTKNIGVVMRKILGSTQVIRKSNEQEIVEAFYRYALGLGDIVEAEYPLAMLASDRVIQDREASLRIAQRVFVRKEKDASGVTRLALEEAFHVRSR
jgi:hypothetical protein